MIKAWIIRFEFHWGYWPHFSIKRKPRPGMRVSDGGKTGVLVACHSCSGDGLLFQEDGYNGQFWGGLPLTKPVQSVTEYRSDFD